MENAKDPNRRDVLRGLISSLGVAAVAGSAAAREKVAEQKVTDNYANDPEIVKEYRENIKRAEQAMLERIREYEHRLRESHVFETGTFEETIGLLRRGLSSSSPEGRESGPNDAPLNPQLAPSLYPRFESDASDLHKRYPGLRILFGTTPTNGIRIGTDSVLIPSAPRSIWSKPKKSPYGVKLERVQLRPDDAETGIAQMSDSTTDDIDGRYGVALHTSFPSDRGPWGFAKKGQIFLPGYLLDPEKRPMLQQLVDKSIDTFVPTEMREGMRDKAKKSLVMVGNVSDWTYLMREIYSGESSIGQPVYARAENGSFQLCGMVQDLLPLNIVPEKVHLGAVAYLIAPPETLRTVIR